MYTSAHQPVQLAARVAQDFHHVKMIQKDPHTARLQHLRVIIIGAGIGGLLAAIVLGQDGHDVTVLEQAAEFGEVGAGLRIPPNSFKLLHRWGIDLTFMKKTYSNGNRFLRWDDGQILQHMSHGIPEWDFGGSYLMAHRADYHAVLLEKALELQIDVRKDSRVDEYFWDLPAVKLQTGEQIDGDLLIAADGESSALKQTHHTSRLTWWSMQESKARLGHTFRAMNFLPLTLEIFRIAS